MIIMLVLLYLPVYNKRDKLEEQRDIDDNISGRN